MLLHGRGRLKRWQVILDAFIASLSLVLLLFLHLGNHMPADLDVCPLELEDLSIDLEEETLLRIGVIYRV